MKQVILSKQKQVQQAESKYKPATFQDPLWTQLWTLRDAEQVAPDRASTEVEHLPLPADPTNVMFYYWKLERVTISCVVVFPSFYEWVSNTQKVQKFISLVQYEARADPLWGRSSFFLSFFK